MSDSFTERQKLQHRVVGRSQGVELEIKDALEGALADVSGKIIALEAKASQTASMVAKKKYLTQQRAEIEKVLNEVYKDIGQEIKSKSIEVAQAAPAITISILDQTIGITLGQPKLTKEQVGALGIVANKAEALSRLVDDIISLQQAGQASMRFEALSLTQLGHMAVQAAQASAAEAGITLLDAIPDELPYVMGDKRRLSQVIDNLLQNAIKFSDAGDTVTVRMSEEGTSIRTEVEDTGIGVPPDELTRIFERFYQVDGTTTRRFSGTGLGLAIVKQIVENHNGQVGVESVLGEGSLFYFTIPKANLGS